MFSTHTRPWAPPADKSPLKPDLGLCVTFSVAQYGPSAIPSCWRMDAGLEEISPSLTWCIFLLLLVDYIEPVLKDQAMINLQQMEVFWRTKKIQRSRWERTWEWQRSRGRRVSPAVLQISIHRNQITKCWGSKEMSVVLWTLLECIIR